MRDRSVDVLKGFSIVAVVLHHLWNRRFPPEEIWFRDSVLDLVSWAVFSFLMVSGYLQGKSKRSESFGDIILTRGKRLLVPFVLIAFANALIYLALLQIGLFEAGEFFQKGPLHFFWAVTIPGTDEIAGEQLYFYALLFAITFWFFFARNFFEKFSPLKLTWFFLGLIFFLVLVFKGELPRNGFSSEMIVIGLFHYSSGYFYGQLEKEADVFKWVVLPLAGVAAFAWAVYDSLDVVPMLVPIPFFWALRRLGPILKIFLPFEYLGKASSMIFAYHDPFILQVLLIVLYKITGHTLGTIVASFLLALIICCCIYELSNRTKWFRFLRV